MIPGDVEVALHHLSARVRTCTACALHCTANLGVPGEGPADARVMFIGEAPGMNEDKLGRPFVGAAGKFLDTVLLPAAALRREDVYITNVVKHRPPNNRDPLPEELAACLPYLEEQIDLISPAIIVTLGRFSLGTFFPGDMISRVHGRVREKDGRHFFNMYHPAAALHQERLKQTLEDDMKRLAAFLQSIPDETAGSAGAPVREHDEPEQLTFFNG